MDKLVDLVVTKPKIISKSLYLISRGQTRGCSRGYSCGYSRGYSCGYSCGYSRDQSIIFVYEFVFNISQTWLQLTYYFVQELVFISHSYSQTCPTQNQKLVRENYINLFMLFSWTWLQQLRPILYLMWFYLSTTKFFLLYLSQKE